MDVWIDTQWNNISKYMKNTPQILLKKCYPLIQLQHWCSTLKYISNISHGESTRKILMLPSKIEDQSKYLQSMNLYIVFCIWILIFILLILLTPVITIPYPSPDIELLNSRLRFFLPQNFTTPADVTAIKGNRLVKTYKKFDLL